MTVDVNKAMEYPGLSASQRFSSRFSVLTVTIIQTFVDVRDCALALVKAVTSSSRSRPISV